MRARRWPGLPFYLLAALALALDQATKAWATAALEPVWRRVVIPGFFDLTYERNTGIAFSLFAGEEWLVLVILAVFLVAAVWVARGLDWSRREPNIVGGLLVGGAAGNLLDRLRLGHVVDFLDFHAGPYHWPVFNLADSLICIAVGWIALRQLRNP